MSSLRAQGEHHTTPAPPYTGVLGQTEPVSSASHNKGHPDEDPARSQASCSYSSYVEKLCVVIPAFNEDQAVSSVVHELRACLPQAALVVVNDGSTDNTAEAALLAGATVLSLPANLGIGGAVQTGYRYALRHGFRYAMQVDGDGQHDAAEASRLLNPVFAGNVDLTLGSRWLGRGDYAAPRGRRVGMHILSALVRWRTGVRFTDTTSGFRALGPTALRLFATTYPTDFPEVESIVLACQSNLCVMEVPVSMRNRPYGRSSLAGMRSAYYMARVAAALVIGSKKPADQT